MVTMKMAKTALLRVQADGRLQAEDYARHTPQLDRLARLENGPIPVLVELGPRFEGQHLPTLWRQVKIKEQHRRMVGPVAVVGDRRWQLLARMANAFFPYPIRFFARDETAQAENWLRRGADRGEA